jgi:predicted DNA-binding transcriptional regulator AlpA
MRQIISYTITPDEIQEMIYMAVKASLRQHLVQPESKEPEQAISLSEAASFCGYSIPGFRKRLTGNNPAPYHRPDGAKDFKFFKTELNDWIKSRQKNNPRDG